MEKKLDILTSQGKTLLHIAPEECIEKNLRHILKGGYISVDKSSKRAMFNMDVTNLQFQDEYFDIVYCSHVLEHVIDDLIAMKEMWRVLKRDGWAIINVPVSSRRETFEDIMVVDPLEREMLFGQGDHVRIYGKDYITRLRSCGFFVKEIKAKDFISKKDIELMGITKVAGSIFLCRKVEK
jgi:ubiquinone/menaquinone biosynthesis C-methylase UbiE